MVQFAGPRSKKPTRQITKSHEPWRRFSLQSRIPKSVTFSSFQLVSALILDASKGVVDILIRRPRANKQNKLGDRIAMSVTHDGDQVLQELPVVVQIEFLLANLLAALR